MAPPPKDLLSFIDRSQDRLIGALFLHCGDRGVAEELAQETLVRICRDWERVREMEAPGAWAHRVAINLANSHYRRRAAERRARARHDARAERDLQATPPDAADALAVRRAVGALPPRQRDVVILHYFSDLPLAQIATATGRTESAVKSLLHRARATLRDDLDLDLDDSLSSGPHLSGRAPFHQTSSPRSTSTSEHRNG